MIYIKQQNNIFQIPTLTSSILEKEELTIYKVHMFLQDVKHLNGKFDDLLKYINSYY